MSTSQAGSTDAFRDSAEDFLGRIDQRVRTRKLRGSATGLDRAVWQQIAAVGWLSILVPEGQGGLGLGMAEVAAIAMVAGRELLPEPFVAVGVQVVATLCALPGSATRTALLEKICSGDLLAALAWQDRAGQLEPYPHGGKPADGMIVLSEADKLEGHKRFVTPGQGTDGWLVHACQKGESCLVWVPSDTAGVEQISRERIDGSRMSSIRFDSTPVEKSNVLARGDEATRAIRRGNAIALIAQSAELLGIARKACELTQAYMLTRVQFGKPIGSFQALQHRLVDAWIQVELADAVVESVVSNEELDEDELSRQASRAKARCAAAALHVTQMAIQMHGAIGFTDECDIGLYYKRALHLASWLGNVSAHQRRYMALTASSTPVRDDSEATSTSLPEAGSGFPRDADWEAMGDAPFRQMLRDFFRRHYPEDKRHLPRRQHWDETKEWYLTLSRQGWIAPGWPKAFGGMGLGTERWLAFIEEQENHGVARLVDAGLTMAGPILIRYGTPEQQAHYLPKILSGEHIWSQGYSEPNAGSDLASLRTEAVLEGDEFVVNGQKIWTTMAQESTHIFMLVRTDRNARKQAGISFLLADIKSPGITVRVIRDIVGHEHFCEVFFDNVKVPASNLVGEINQGWTIAKALLGFERIFLGSPKQCQTALAHLQVLAGENHLMDEPEFAAQFARLQMDVDDLASAFTRFSDAAKRGEALPPSVSWLKIWATETYRSIGQLLRESGHEAGGDHPDEGRSGPSDNLLTSLINSASATIYGGSNEIQRNILAKVVLRLPD